METSELRQRLESELGLIAWTDLREHFARGAVLEVTSDLDPLDVAEAMIHDRSDQVAPWIESGSLGAVSDEQARTWFESSAEVLAIVIHPWVLVQHHDPS